MNPVLFLVFHPVGRELAGNGVGAAEVGAAETQGHQQERIILGILGRNPFNQNSMDIG